MPFFNKFIRNWRIRPISHLILFPNWHLEFFSYFVKNSSELGTAAFYVYLSANVKFRPINVCLEEQITGMKIIQLKKWKQIYFTRRTWACIVIFFTYAIISKKNHQCVIFHSEEKKSFFGGFIRFPLHVAMECQIELIFVEFFFLQIYVTFVDWFLS